MKTKPGKGVNSKRVRKEMCLPLVYRATNEVSSESMRAPCLETHIPASDLVIPVKKRQGTKMLQQGRMNFVRANHNKYWNVIMERHLPYIGPARREFSINGYAYLHVCDVCAYTEWIYVSARHRKCCTTYLPPPSGQS
jgi:hypothetical protein